MARRGFLVQLARAAKAAARERERAQRAAVREHNAAVRFAERARRASEHAHAQLARASQAERKRLQREARGAYVDSMEAGVEERNLNLAEIYDEIDSLLNCTLDIDDYVDLETLRVPVEHPPFDHPELELSIPSPKPIPTPPEPGYVAPVPPKGLASLFGKKRHATNVARELEAHQNRLVEWKAKVELMETQRRSALEAHAAAEARRVANLSAARTRYAEECAARELEGSERNRQVDELIANLGYGTVAAVQEYVSIVLSNSVYPGHFPVTHEFEFEPSSAELQLRVSVPEPATIPTIKAYKYTKSSDEIVETPLSQKACRDRYANAVHQVALRSLHEVFEADRRGIIKTISLTVGTHAVDPGTGTETYLPFVIVGAERDSFLKFNLSAVVPAMTLDRLGAAVSKNPYGLVSVDGTGVRRS